MSRASDRWLAAYPDLVTVLSDLPVIARETRRRKGLSLRDAGAEMGLSASTLMRLEEGDAGANLSTVRAVLLWASS